MKQNAIEFEFLGPDEKIGFVKISGDVKAQSVVSALQRLFREKLAQGVARWIVDLSQMPFPTTTMIAFLISATQQARELGGDLKLLNAPDSARNNLVTFSPLTYLSLANSMNEIADEFNLQENDGGVLPHPRLQNVDIAEPPLLEELPEITQDATDDVAIPVSENATTEPKQEKERHHNDADHSEQQPVEPSVAESIDELQRFYLKTPSIASNLYKICDFVVEHSRKAGMDEKQIVKSKIAVYEACLNVIEHAYHSRPDNWIEVWVEYNAEYFKITIQDYGQSFERKQVAEYDVEAAVERRQTGGFGLHIIERSMDKVEYFANGVDGNRLILTKYLSK